MDQRIEKEDGVKGARPLLTVVEQLPTSARL